MNDQIPKTTRDLRASERRFLDAMQQLCHGKFESVQILRGELVLEPWPATIRSVKFGNAHISRILPPADFELKSSVIELLVHVRSTEVGVIRVLEVRGGLPFCMEIEEDKNPEDS